jgi:gliding motility-associated-like protein
LVDLGNDTTFCLGDLPLNAFNNSSGYMWSTGQTTPGIIVTSPNTYWVKVTNQYGCINSDTLIVHPQLDAFNFVLPNIVTPNNDGINDFIDFGKYQFSSLQIEIYNRWGKKVFESTDPACVWKPTEEDGIYYSFTYCY